MYLLKEDTDYSIQIKVIIIPAEFSLLLLSDSFKLNKFWLDNMNEMEKDENVNFTATLFCPLFQAECCYYVHLLDGDKHYSLRFAETVTKQEECFTLTQL